MLDAISEVRLGDVYPGLASKIRQMATMLPEGLTFRVTQGLRSWADQAKLYAQGRTAPGAIVTNAPPGYSWHQWSVAVDIVPMEAGHPDWNIEHPSWPKLISLGKSLGLESGAEWQHPDWPHFQMTGSFPVSPNDRARQILLNEGIEAFWLEAFK